MECQHSSVGGTTRRRKSARIPNWTLLSNLENWNLWTRHPNCNRTYMLSIIHRVFKKIDRIIIIQPLKKLNSYFKTFLKNIQAQPVPLENLLCKGGKSSEPHWAISCTPKGALHLNKAPGRRNNKRCYPASSTKHHSGRQWASTEYTRDSSTGEEDHKLEFSLCYTVALAWFILLLFFVLLKFMVFWFFFYN